MGPEGGSIEVDGLVLDVPPGALTGETTIRVARASTPAPEAYDAFSPVFEFAPEGLEFPVPLSVTIEFDQHVVDPTVFWTEDLGTHFVAIGGTPSKTVIIASVSHFSKGFVGANGKRPCKAAGGGTVPQGESQQLACGRNDAGTLTQTCVAGVWQDVGVCSDPDVCTNGAAQTVTCGFNGAGAQSQLCAAGQWIDDGACADPDACVNGSAQTVTCGLNAAGSQPQLCEVGQWQPDGDCVDQDVCINGAERGDACGLNGNGTQGQLCVGGQWSTLGACVDPDVCVNASSQSIACGYNGNGEQGQICESGQWQDSGGCADPDACPNTDTKIVACGLNGTGMQTQECVQGQWQDSGGCADPDVCVSATTQTIACGYNGNGAQPQLCTAGQWQDNGTCTDPDECTNDAAQLVTCGIGDVGSQPQRCTGGQWQNDGGCADFVEVHAGSMHTCARRSDGTVWCWGDNAYGELGDGTTTLRTSPVRVTALGTAVVEIAVFDQHSCARKTDGTVWCWGYNDMGQLGDGTTTDRSTPVQVAGLIGAVEIAVGSGDTCARRSDGTLWCWGYNIYGQIGDGTTVARATPVQVTALGTTVAEVDLGRFHSCARKTDGTMWCWGDDSTGALGDGASGPGSTMPQQVVAMGTSVAQISAGGNHTCARKTDDTLWCWGGNSWGQVGDSTTTDRPNPTEITALAAVIDISAGGGWDSVHTCARTGDGALWCWGHNNVGQLGDGTTMDRAAPVEVTALANVTAVSAGRLHTCAIESGGTLSCWGQNWWGQLGNATQTGATPNPSPTTVLPPVPGSDTLTAPLVSTISLGGRSQGQVQALGMSYYIATQGVIASVSNVNSSGTPFVGQIMQFAGGFAPGGWKLCDGSILPIATNQALFNLIGTTYGGDGTTGFAIPDLRARAPMGVGTLMNASAVTTGSGTSLVPQISNVGWGASSQGQVHALGMNYLIATSGAYPSSSGPITNANNYLGELMIFAGNFAPAGWAICDGSMLTILDNSALFSLLGTTYGGDGVTSFAIPDLRGRLAIGRGALTSPTLPPSSSTQIPLITSIGQGMTAEGQVGVLGITYAIAEGGLFPSPTGSITSVGPYYAEVLMFAGDFAPGGWMECNGASLDISLHEALFSLIGTFYGGDGMSTFALPDLRARVAMGPGSR